MIFSLPKFQNGAGSRFFVVVNAAGLSFQGICRTRTYRFIYPGKYFCSLKHPRKNLHRKSRREAPAWVGVIVRTDMAAFSLNIYHKKKIVRELLEGFCDGFLVLTGCLNSCVAVLISIRPGAIE